MVTSLVTMADAQLRLKFIPSHRGGRILCFQGFMFRCDKKKDTWQYWICKTKTCPARVSTVDDVITRIGEPHNHENRKGTPDTLHVLGIPPEGTTSERNPHDAVRGRWQETTEKKKIQEHRRASGYIENKVGGRCECDS